MGHRVTAIIARGPANLEAAEEYDLPVMELKQGFELVHLDIWHRTYWEQKIKTESLREYTFSEGRMRLDDELTHYWARRLFEGKPYALIETDYFGGIGTQAAAVYEEGCVKMSTEEGGINKALRVLGVEAQEELDEFDSVELNRHRESSDYFEKYYEM